MKDLHESDLKKIKRAKDLALAATSLLVNEKKQTFKKEEKKLNLRKNLVTFFRVLTVLVTAAAFILAFHFSLTWGLRPEINPEYAKILMPFSIISFGLLLWLENIWAANIEEKLKEAKKRGDPTLANQAINFLKSPDILTHLQTILEPTPPKETSKINFANLIVDLAVSLQWIVPSKNVVEAKKDNIEEILSEAYSENPKTFEKEYLKEWREEFESFQKELKIAFGKDLDFFCKKIEKQKTYFLECFQSIVSSKSGKEIKNLLKAV